MHTVHVTRNFTISADLPRGFSAHHLRNPCRFSAEFVGFCKVSCDMYRMWSMLSSLL